MSNWERCPADGRATDRAVLMCGPAGAGKSTFARALEADGYVRLSFDEIAWDLGHRTHPVPAQAAKTMHELIQNRLAQVLADGGRVVVDTSFWSRATRARYRTFIESLGVVPVVYYLDTPRATILARLAARTGAHGDDAVVPTALARSYLGDFEVPTADEGPLRVIASTTEMP